MSKIVRSKIRCVVSGETYGVQPKVFDERAVKAGSPEELLRTYVGRDAKRLLRDGLSVDQIRAKFGANEADLPTADELATIVAKITCKGNQKAKTVSTAAPTKEEVTLIADSSDADVDSFLEPAEVPADTTPAIAQGVYEGLGHGLVYQEVTQAHGYYYEK